MSFGSLFTLEEVRRLLIFGTDLSKLIGCGFEEEEFPFAEAKFMLARIKLGHHKSDLSYVPMVRDYMHNGSYNLPQDQQQDVIDRLRAAFPAYDFSE